MKQSELEALSQLLNDRHDQWYARLRERFGDDFIMAGPDRAAVGHWAAAYLDMELTQQGGYAALREALELAYRLGLEAGLGGPSQTELNA